MKSVEYIIKGRIWAKCWRRLEDHTDEEVRRQVGQMRAQAETVVPLREALLWWGLEAP